jgi:hypothetical protein
MDLSSRIEALEGQISDLQAATLPSYDKPWEIEVIVFPYGPALKGIWSTIENFPSQRSRQNSMASDDWTYSQLKIMSKSQAETAERLDDQTGWEELMQPSGSQGDSWLVAKACAVGSRTYERLRSRGLVKTIEVTGPDAGSLQMAIMAAFDDLLTFFPPSPELDPSVSKFMGLQTPFIPFRKLHKDSRLRYLQPEEMVTSTLWTAPFIHSSVAMKAAGSRKLFVTQRESYLQHSCVDAAYWTWQRIKELPKAYVDAESNSPHGGATFEACWEYDERFDPQPVHMSFSSQHSSLSFRPAGHETIIIPSSPSDHFSSAAVSPVQSEPENERPKKRKSNKPNRSSRSPIITRSQLPRPISMPTSVPIRTSPPSAKRRLSPADYDAEPDQRSSAANRLSSITMKKRRLSKSPSRPRDTPRWSIESSSPYIFPEDIPRRRASTPFGYATPHSNTPHVELHSSSAGGLDLEDEEGSMDDIEAELARELDEMSDDGEPDFGHQTDDVDAWEGMEEQLGSNSEREDGDADVDDRDDLKSNASSAPSMYPSTQPRDTALYVHMDPGDAADEDDFYNGLVEHPSWR